MVRRVCVLVYPGVTLLDVAGPVEVFTEANAGGARYEISLVSLTGGVVPTSSGLGLEVAPVSGQERYHTLIVPGGTGVPTLDPGLVDTVRDLASRSRRVVSICTGSFFLAEAGLLDGLAATTHWRYVDDLARRYPRVAVERDAIFVRSGRVFTSAGVSAGIDLALALVQDDHGSEMARDVARSLVVFLHRAGGQSQFSTSTSLPSLTSDVVKTVVGDVSADPSREHTLTSMADSANISTRHLSRLFSAELGMTPTRFVELCRMETAQALLLNGASITDAAAASGFGSDEVLRRAFIRTLGVTPTTYRARFANALAPPKAKAQQADRHHGTRSSH